MERKWFSEIVSASVSIGVPKHKTNTNGQGFSDSSALLGPGQYDSQFSYNLFDMHLDLFLNFTCFMSVLLALEEDVLAKILPFISRRGTSFLCFLAIWHCRSSIFL